MATQQQTPATPESDKAEENGPDNEGTFETDISETGEDGTSVRQAEVDEDDLSEGEPPQEKSDQ
jgi:hypothetical protein